MAFEVFFSLPEMGLCGGMMYKCRPHAATTTCLMVVHECSFNVLSQLYSHFLHSRPEFELSPPLVENFQPF